MTYNPAVPLNSDSPSLLPGQCQANFTRLQALLGADHQFNLSSASNDGYHNLIHMTPQAPSGVLTGIGRVYVKIVAGVVQLFYMTDAGTEIQLTPAASQAGVFAAVNFNGVGSPSIRSQSNVASVTRLTSIDSQGAYRITFTAAASTNNYIVQVTGQRNDTNLRVSNGCVVGSTSYGTSQTTSHVDVAFFGSGESFRDVIMGNVVVYLV